MGGRDCYCVPAEGGVAWGLGEKGADGLEPLIYVTSGKPQIVVVKLLSKKIVVVK